MFKKSVKFLIRVTGQGLKKFPPSHIACKYGLMLCPPLRKQLLSIVNVPKPQKSLFLTPQEIKICEFLKRLAETRQ